MIERLSGEFNRGYTKAIQDIQEVFDYIDDDLRHHNKRLTHKLAKELISCCLMNREHLRESMNGFIRYNVSTNEFEFYEPAEEYE